MRILLKAIASYAVSIVLELLSILVVIATYPLALFDIDRKSVPLGTKRVALFLHGFMHNRSAWLYTKFALRRSGITLPLFTVNLGHPFQSIEQYVARAQKRLIQIKEMAKSQELELILVGHSLGGVVCAHYSLDCAAGDNIRVVKMITIASPLRGTPLSYLGAPFSPAVRQILPHSDYLKGLCDKLRCAGAEAFPMIQLSCAADFVVPPSYASLDRVNSTTLSMPNGHVFALYSPKVIALIKEELQR